MAISEELDPYRGKDIVVIMSDGRGYRGLLDKVDSETIILKDVYETLNQEVDEKGYMFWRKVLHSKLILRVPMVLRIWPWDAPRPGAKG